MNPLQNKPPAGILPSIMDTNPPKPLSPSYKILRCDDPEKLLKETSPKVKMLKNLAKVIMVVACIALGAASLIAMAGIGGGMGATGFGFVLTLISNPLVDGPLMFVVKTMGTMFGLGAAGGGLWFLSQNLDERAVKILSDDDRSILIESIKIKKDASFFTSEIEKLKQTHDRLSGVTKDKLKIVGEFLANPNSCDDPMIKAQWLIQLRAILNSAEILSREVTRVKQSQKHPIEWDQYGVATAWKTIEVVVSEDPSRQTLEQAQQNLDTHLANVQVILKGMSKGI